MTKNTRKMRPTRNRFLAIGLLLTSLREAMMPDARRSDEIGVIAE